MGDATFRGYQAEELKAAFDLVKNKDDWKDPICALVPADILDIVCAAIEFFTATLPAVFLVDFDCKEFVVVAPGYRNGPCGSPIIKNNEKEEKHGSITNQKAGKTAGLSHQPGRNC